MANDMTPQQINDLIDQKIARFAALSNKKYGDTPTDNNQLTPKRYVTSVVSGVVAIPGGSNKEIQFNNAGVFGGSPAFTLDVTSVPGFPVLTLTGTSGGATPTWVISENGTSVRRTVQGTQNTSTSAAPVSTSLTTTATDTTIFLELFTTAFRTGGSSGATGDSGAYIRRAVFKNIAGTVSLVGSIQDGFTSEDQAAWDVTFTVGGAAIAAQFTGAANNNITWDSILVAYY